MGNSGSLPHSAPRLSEFALRGFSVAALNYRGAGGQPGAPTEDALISDALTIYDQFTTRYDHAGLPVIYGTSLGAAVAVALAAPASGSGLGAGDPVQPALRSG